MSNGSLLVCMFRKLPSVWGGAANVSVSALGSLGHFPPVRRHPGTNSDVCSIGSEPIPVWVTDTLRRHAKRNTVRVNLFL